MTDDLWAGQNKALGAFIRAQRELASLADKIHVSRLLAAIKSANERRARRTGGTRIARSLGPRCR